MSERTYEVRISGLIPTEELADDLRDVELAEHEFRTVLSGRFVDQSALYGFLNLLRSYDLEIVEVRRVPEPGPVIDTAGGSGEREAPQRR